MIIVVAGEPLELHKDHVEISDDGDIAILPILDFDISLELTMQDLEELKHLLVFGGYPHDG